jgi:hypothetical protein
MDTTNPFSLSGHWYKGQLHVHTTRSDGRRTPEEVMGWYRERGYHFLALTDHSVLSEARTVADDFVTLAGIEVDGVDPERGMYHLVALGMRRPPNLGGSAASSMQGAISRLRAAGALVAIAHPYWSGQMSKDLLGLEGCFALELYNGSCDVDDAKGFSTVHWDDLLAAGCRISGLAVDDAHWRRGDYDAGLGWVWVRAPVLTPAAILKALALGHFYASTGPEIHGLRLKDGWLYVDCSPAVAVDFLGNGPKSRRIVPPLDETLTEASYQLRKGQRYVRVACQAAGGGWAWTNPIFLDEQP